MKKITNVLVGSDPEFFIKKDGDFFPSFNVIQGTKSDPTDIGSGYQILKDNVLLEGNIPPASTKKEFIHNMKYLKSYFINMLSENDMSLVCADSGVFQSKFLRHPDATEFGCSPYMNCWDMNEHRADDMSDMNHRVAGFHIHIGYDTYLDKTFLNQIIAKAFDYFLVYPSRLKHNDEIRSVYYGGYGNYRDKEYGLECRSLGGKFTEDKYLGKVYDNVMKMIKFINSTDGIEKIINLGNSFSEAHYNMLGINIENLKF